MIACFVIFLGVGALVAWAFVRAPHSKCENPQCEDCPFPKCKRGE